MRKPFSIKPDHKSIKAYHQSLKDFAAQNVEHESAVRRAFEQLLETHAKAGKWLLVPELSEMGYGAAIRPDGTLRDENGLPRGYWEAKDSQDDLDAEIKKKIAKGYPTFNIIFEDTQRAVLFQNKKRIMEADLQKASDVADLLTAFFNYSEPDIERFEKAVDEFKVRVPGLAQGLADKIRQAHEDNPKFQAAFQEFYALCRTSLNPNLSRDAVEEMIVQHLLTERLLRRIFNNPDFTRRNVIAFEVEKVIDQLTSHYFDRSEFLKSLDPFYVAVENAAELLDFHDKQLLLNSVYEKFFQGYCVKTADTHGIVYTPAPIVEFMCNSVVEVLENEFGKTLGDDGVNVLDPCTGTGNYIVHLMQKISKRNLPKFYQEHLFANEVMLMPYYIAALNIEHAYMDITGKYEPFEGLCFVDTLDLVEHKFAANGQTLLMHMNEENSARVERQTSAPITVIIGNPPYNVGQLNENDNNKNRHYDVVDTRIRNTYVKDSNATNKNALYDAYVRFFRWASDRLNGRDGIVCFVSNNNFVNKYAMDGMRKHLLDDFNVIYHLDLHGDVRQNPKISGTSHNVFGIKVGVGITVAAKVKKKKKHSLHYLRMDEFWRKEDKYEFLNQHQSVSNVKWQKLKIDHQSNWIRIKDDGHFQFFISIGGKLSKREENGNCQTIFKSYSSGLKSNRDATVFNFNVKKLESNTKYFIDQYIAEVNRFERHQNKDDIDNFVSYEKIKWDSTLKNKLKSLKKKEFDEENLVCAMYRPFSKQFLYFDEFYLNSVYLLKYYFPHKNNDNKLILVPGNGNRTPFSTFITCLIPALDFAFEKAQCFPFYVYEKDGSNRRENITGWALEQFRSHYHNKKITKWDIFYYVYGLLHHPGYRERYGDSLKRELPRIPFAPDFFAFSKAGKKLAEWHLNYEDITPYPLEYIETPDEPLSYRVKKMRLSKDKEELSINGSLTLRGIPKEAFEYRLGNRSALEWVIDQYQVKEHNRSGIVSDPNREDDPEYIVRLVGQVVQVSVETVRIVNSLPAECSETVKSS